MRVFHVAPTRLSESSAAWRIMNAQRRIGIDAEALVHVSGLETPHTLYFPGKKNPIVNQYKINSKLNAILTRIANSGKPALPWSYNVFSFMNLKVLNNENYDIINLHWIPSVGNLDLLSKLGKPIVITPHDVWPLTGGCHCNLECENWESGCFKCPQNHASLIKTLSPHNSWNEKKKQYERIENLSIAAPSQWIANMAARSPLFENRKIAVTPNCVDPAEFPLRNKVFSKKVLGLDADKKHLLFVTSGYLSQFHKGLDLLQTILVEFEKLFDFKNLEVLLVGKQSERFKYESKISMKFLGEITSASKMSEIYASTDVVVSCSRQDNLPSVLIEASMSGVACVAFDVGGIGEIIEDGKNGYLIEKGDVNGFVNRIALELKLPRAPEEIRNLAISRFAPEVSAAQYFNLYTDILKD